jgi:hypothetical protein
MVSVGRGCLATSSRCRRPASGCQTKSSANRISESFAYVRFWRAVAQRWVGSINTDILCQTRAKRHDLYCQRFANEIRKPNENKRDQSPSDSSGFTGFFRFRDSLITVWLEVRVLPGPPPSLAIPPFVETCDHGPPLAGFFALSFLSLRSCRRIRPY